MDTIAAQRILQTRLRRPPAGPVDIRSDLRHFALINYALPKSRLEPHIPGDRFLIPEFEIGGRPMALLSIVPFFDDDFRFIRLAPFLKFHFGQTNHRVYVIDRATGQHVVWFFGTTLGSPLVHAARQLWGIPWHRAHYTIDCRFDETEQRYARFSYQVEGTWGAGELTLEDTGRPPALAEGFGSLEEMMLILTQPVTGFYHRLNGRLGSYSVWHDLIPLTQGRLRHLYFGLYEELGLLSATEMLIPHSIFLSRRVTFDVHLPPRKLA